MVILKQNHDGGLLEDLEPVCNRMTAKIFSNPLRFGFESSDEAAEMYLNHGDRLKTIARKSLGMGSGSTAYIDTCVRYLAKSIQRSKRRKDLRESVLESSHVSYGSSVALTQEPSSPLRPNNSRGGSDNEEAEDRDKFIASITPGYFLERMDATGKRLLYLIVKCAWEADDAIISRCSRRIGVPVCWLEALIARARTSLDPLLRRREKICQSLNAVWIQLRILECKFASSAGSAELRSDLERKIAKYRGRYASLLERRERSKLLVPNRVIAEILDVPKGSVDSGLYYFKAACERELARERCTG